MRVRGSVDVVAQGEVRGWAYAPDRPEPVMVQAVLNNEILGEAVANLHRADLAAAGLGDGNSGYAMKLFRPVDPLYFPFVTVKVDGGDAELPRAPMLGFAEFFAGLHRTHPSAGRHRSVFGGLWTDRTDAAALLRGKATIGQVQAAVATPLMQLVRSGFAMLEAPGVSPMSQWRAAPAEQAVALLEHPGVLPALQAALEDDPLALAADWVGGGAEALLAQPSAANPSPSPAECLALVVPFADGVALEVVRDSHLLPEFSPGGQSRWLSRAAGHEVAAARSLLERHALPVGSVALVGAGALFRPHGEGAALRLLCVPSRLTPMALLADGSRVEWAGPLGARAWLSV